MVASIAVLADVAVPTLVLLLLAALSLALRREWLGSLGLHAARALPLAGKMLVFAAAWSLLQLSVTMPVANHLSGSRQDLSDFATLEGNGGMLAALLLLRWTLAAFGEEAAYRGYLQTRAQQALAFSVLRLHYGTLWAPILAHGFNNTLGFVAFFLVGPIHGFW